jgi:ParB-like chromosome segregation protein Spo0J
MPLAATTLTLPCHKARSAPVNGLARLEEALDMSGYQIMRDLSADEYAELKNDIAERGVLVPVEYDEDDNILDGHHWVKACQALGIMTWLKITRSRFTAEEKHRYARKLNLASWHLNQAQRRELIEARLKETPEKSDRQIAESLGGNHETVGAQRARLVASGDVAKSAKSTDTFGRKQPRRRKYQFNDNMSEGRRASHQDRAA